MAADFIQSAGAYIFSLPQGLLEVAKFTLKGIYTWGGERDAATKEMIKEVSGIGDRVPDGGQYVFAIRAYLHQSRIPKKRRIPDIENIPKLIVDAFRGILFDDDNWRFVRAVQAEGLWIDEDDERTDVWIYRLPEANS